MTITLLLDLDDTLLLDEMETVFAPAYFRALGQTLFRRVPPQQLNAALLAASARMMENRHPGRTLRQVFDQTFFPAVGLQPEALAAEIERFYAQEYPRLQSLTRPAPGVQDFVAWAFSQGYRVAIATNPLFPLEAQHWRLRWAGLPPEDFPFACISSYETFHFTKPSPWYYAEMLARLGWPEAPVLMVGDSPTLDIAPCLEIGLPVFQVQREGTGRPRAADPSAAPAGYGTLADLKHALETGSLRPAAPDWQRPAALLAALAATPAALHARLAALPPADWTQRPAPASWSLTEILCHLRDVEREVNLPRLRRVLAEEDAFITARETDAWASERNYAAQDGPQALADFIAARRETLALLAALSPEQWQRGLRHSIFGRSTLRELVFFTWRHDRDHLRQALETAAA